MVKRQISTRTYVVAGIFTLMIFSLGLLLGLLIEGSRLRYIEDQSRIQNIEFNSLQLQYAYLQQVVEQDNCEVVYNTFQNYIKSLEAARIKLETYDEDSKISDEEFDLLKREYILAQTRYWLLSEETKNVCEQDFATILYFFSNEDECSLCDRQGFVLTYLKNLLKEKVLVFSFDGRDSNEPLVDLLISAYDIDEYPSIVVDGEVIRGFVDKGGLFERLCENHNFSIEECED